MRMQIAAAAAMALAATGCERAKEAATSTTPATIRVATFNASLNRETEGGLIASLSTKDDAQARAVAEIIQRARPDIILVSEFDYDATGRALALFQENYLAVGQNGAAPIAFPYQMQPPVNTGVASGVDLDRDGSVGGAPGTRDYGGDAFGYGVFPGQYGFVILSKYPFEPGAARTFQRFLWKDMPGALLPDAPGAPGGYYSKEALAVLRLSSKTHIDAPVKIGRETIHILASHPTPPAFDGPEDRNGRRNHDEIRLWADYIAGEADYLVDDEGGKAALPAGARFVLLGDQNADPEDGGSVDRAIRQVLDSPLVQNVAPTSAGAEAAAAAQGGANAAHKTPAAEDTADFSDGEDGPGNLRIDYVLPSKAGFAVKGSGVFWPKEGETGYALVGPGWPVVSSDHRLVWVDLQLAK